MISADFPAVNYSLSDILETFIMQVPKMRSHVRRQTRPGKHIRLLLPGESGVQEPIRWYPQWDSKPLEPLEDSPLPRILGVFGYVR